MLKRKVYSQLLKWKNSNNKKCLILKGARQVGKTYVVRAFGEAEYEPSIAYKVISGNVGEADGKLSIPHYMVMFL